MKAFMQDIGIVVPKPVIDCPLCKHRAHAGGNGGCWDGRVPRGGGWIRCHCIAVEALEDTHRRGLHEVESYDACELCPESEDLANTCVRCFCDRAEHIGLSLICMQHGGCPGFAPSQASALDDDGAYPIG